jgi:PAS domain S-box-containing protein
MVPSSEALYEGLFELAPDAVVVVNRAGQVALVNRQVERMFGHGRNELLGQPLEILAPARLRMAYAELLTCAGSDTPPSRALDLVGLHKDGSEFPVEITLSTTGAGRGRLVVLAIRNVSQQKQAQQELQARARQQAAVSELGRRALTGIDLPQLMAEAAAVVRAHWRWSTPTSWSFCPTGG